MLGEMSKTIITCIMGHGSYVTAYVKIKIFTSYILIVPSDEQVARISPRCLGPNFTSVTLVLQKGKIRVGNP